MLNKPGVVLVGTSGYGLVHLNLLKTFAAQGKLQLVGVVVFGPDLQLKRELESAGCRVFDSFEAMVIAWSELEAQLCVLPTPIHLHVSMATTMLHCGAHVLVEKPVGATAAGALALGRLAQDSNRLLAVGFQYLHAPEVRELKRRLIAGAIGKVQRIVVHVMWPRSKDYYTRNAWAGRARVEENLVLDSPVNNAMSHFLMLMLYLAGDSLDTAAEPTSLRAELYRAQSIEMFDTAVLRMTTAAGYQLAFYGTHSSAETAAPTCRIIGTLGEANWIQDGFASIKGGSGDWFLAAHPESATREAMLTDVLSRVSGVPAFVCTPEMAAIHARCVDALHHSATIHDVPQTELRERTDGDQEFTYVRGLGEVLTKAAESGTGLQSIGVEWAVAPQPIPLV
jgi:predicted dehydrogenase